MMCADLFRQSCSIGCDMAVYVDDYRAPYRGMRMSHLTADTVEELHEMAETIGLKREWFQKGSHPHYDVSESKRQQALVHGAIEETVRDGAIRRMRQRDERKRLGDA